MHEVCYRDLTAADMPLPIGAVRPNHTAYVADEQTQHPVSAGIPGQLYASRHSLVHGWTRAHLTGDRAYLRESDGVFVLLEWIAGDFQVKIRGQRLDVREVEASIVSTSNGQISGAVVHLCEMSSLKPLSLLLIHTYPSTSTSTNGPALHFVSTAGVAALTNNQQDLYERRLLGQPIGSSNTRGCVASKWACETFLENVAAADTGLRIVVHRPTAIVGPDAPRLDVMHNVINLAEQLRCVPQMRALEGWFQFVPIEVITRDMLDDILGNRSGGGYAVPDDSLGPRIWYHNHCGPEEETVEIHNLGEYLGKKQGVQFETVEDHEWVRRANAIGAAAETTEYLLTIGDKFEKTGAKWIFPRVWNRPDGLRSD